MNHIQVALLQMCQYSHGIYVHISIFIYIIMQESTFYFIHHHQSDYSEKYVLVTLKDQMPLNY